MYLIQCIFWDIKKIIAAKYIILEIYLIIFIFYIISIMILQEILSFKYNNFLICEYFYRYVLYIVNILYFEFVKNVKEMYFFNFFYMENT